MGYRIKLLGITRRRDDLATAPGGAGIELRVHPTLIPASRLIANVEGAMNAVVVQGDAVGTTLYYGKGAGAEPTASAVVADLVDITRLHTADPDHRVPHLAFQRGALHDTPILPIDDVVTAFYLRLVVADKAGVLARITGILADNDISIDAVLQRESAEGEHPDELRLWLRLLTCTQLIEKQVRTDLREQWGTTLPRFDLMAQLEREPEGMRMNELSRRMMVTGGNITGITDQLEAEGLVERAEVEGDRRAYLVRLTPKGRQQFNAMAQAHEAWIVDAFASLSARDIQTLHALLGKVKDHFQETA